MIRLRSAAIGPIERAISRRERMTQILILNGPNLNLLGQREPEIYGAQSLADIEDELKHWAEGAGAQIEMRQTNHEGEMLDWLHAANGAVDGIALNPGAWAHSSIALADAVAGIDTPVIEVHLSNVYAREAFRHHSYLSAKAAGIISGLGALGYRLAAEALLARHTNETTG